MDELNTKMAASLVQGKLNDNPLVQGILVQCMRTLDRLSEGKKLQGRWKDNSATEEMLVRDAALTLAMHGNNQRLAVDLGQNRIAPTISMETLVELGLPNPALSLMFPQQLEQNVLLITNRFPRTPEMPEKRLICALDATYLLKSYSQMRLHEQDGLVGGPWSPSDASLAFVPFKDLASKKPEKAAVMLEALVWDPNAFERRSLSLASMPMRLGPEKSKVQSAADAGRWDTWQSYASVRTRMRALLLRTTHIFKYL